MFARSSLPHDQQLQLQQTFCLLLGESPERARKLTRRWYQHRTSSQQMWQHCAKGSLASIAKKANAIDLPAEAALTEWLANCNLGTVLLTIHMGEYLYALFRLASLVEKRHIVILRRKAESEEEQACFKRLESLGHQVTTLRHSNRVAIQLIQHLRRGAVAILLFDLPARWGQTSRIRMFGQDLYWVVGPMQIATAGHAKVIPFVCATQQKRAVVELLEPYNYGDNHSHQNVLATDHQQLCLATEQVIRRFPAQWHHWHLVPEMLNETSPS